MSATDPLEARARNTPRTFDGILAALRETAAEAVQECVCIVDLEMGGSGQLAMQERIVRRMRARAAARKEGK